MLPLKIIQEKHPSASYLTKDKNVSVILLSLTRIKGMYFGTITVKKMNTN